ncbi:MAG: hypothetical protein EAZ30_11765 [Betaproteobacteria bacterium]|nr:MAG: hypothetical protein EAZ30_11765 [Betaproteobacteria bacterium]
MNRFTSKVLCLLTLTLPTVCNWAHAAACAVPSIGYATIQAAINDPGCSPINVAAGTFNESLSINRTLTLSGSGANTILNAPSNSAAISLATGANNVVLQNFALKANGGNGIALTGGSISNLTISGVAASGTDNQNESGLFVGTTATITTLNVSNSSFNDFGYGWYFAKAVSADASNVSNVTANGLDIIGNAFKGLYIEKLTNASFTSSRFNDNGLSPSVFNSRVNGGIDINLKAGAYQNLSFNNVEIVGNAVSGTDGTVQLCPGTGGFCQGFGIWLKARSDPAAYNTFPATLTGVSITNSLISNNQRGVLVGDLAASAPNVPFFFPGPSNVTITNNRIINNVPTFVSVPTMAFPQVKTPNSNMPLFGGVIVYTAAAATATINITRNDLSGNAGGTFPTFVYGSVSGWGAFNDPAANAATGILPSGCNFWGATTGAGGVAGGGGTATSPQVDFSAPLVTANLNGVCGADPASAFPTVPTLSAALLGALLMLMIAAAHFAAQRATPSIGRRKTPG